MNTETAWVSDQDLIDTIYDVMGEAQSEVFANSFADPPEAYKLLYTEAHKKRVLEIANKVLFVMGCFFKLIDIRVDENEQYVWLVKGLPEPPYK
jgi:hypothetical protein